MSWKVEYRENALKRLDVSLKLKAMEYIESYLAKLADPRKIGKPLKGEFKGLWRFRWRQNYRVVCEIQEKKITIFVVDVGHRKSIYT